MTAITFHGNTLNTCGLLCEVGAQAPDFTLVAWDLSEKTLTDYIGNRVILNIFPSMDTWTCAMSVKRFNQEVSLLENTVVLCVSGDLPFAQGRFCSAEWIENIVPLSSYRSTFWVDYGVTMTDGPLRWLLSRAVMVLDTTGKVLYTQQVSEVTNEPNYEEVLAVV